jgi:hypothetical protein
LCVKIPATQEVITIWGPPKWWLKPRERQNSRPNKCQCSWWGSQGQRRGEATESRQGKINAQPDCDTKKVLLDEMVWDQAVIIGSYLAPTEEAALIQFLQKNRDVFA